MFISRRSALHATSRGLPHKESVAETILAGIKVFEWQVHQCRSRSEFWMRRPLKRR
jgi:hypothetical protein